MGSSKRHRPRNSRWATSIFLLKINGHADTRKKKNYAPLRTDCEFSTIPYRTSISPKRDRTASSMSSAAFLSSFVPLSSVPILFLYSLYIRESCARACRNCNYRYNKKERDVHIMYEKDKKYLYSNILSRYTCALATFTFQPIVRGGISNGSHSSYLNHLPRILMTQYSIHIYAEYKFFCLYKPGSPLAPGFDSTIEFLVWFLEGENDTAAMRGRFRVLV